MQLVSFVFLMRLAVSLIQKLYKGSPSDICLAISSLFQQFQFRFFLFTVGSHAASWSFSSSSFFFVQKKWASLNTFKISV